MLLRDLMPLLHPDSQDDTYGTVEETTNKDLSAAMWARPSGLFQESSVDKLVPAKAGGSSRSRCILLAVVVVFVIVAAAIGAVCCFIAWFYAAQEQYATPFLCLSLRALGDGDGW